MKIKHYLLLVSLFSVTIFSKAQNWEPITINETFHYRNDTSDVIVTSLKVDSVGVENGDSVWYLNRMMKDLSGGFWSKSGERFLQKKMVRYANGKRNFRIPGNLTLFTLDSIGSSWLFDSVNGISASITAVDTANFWGQLDSVKTFSLSSGDMIQLSKNHGLLRFPTQYSSGHYYKMTGIAGRNLGELLPEFNGIYDFQAGDIYEYNWRWGNYDPGGTSYYPSHRKIQIDSTTVSGNTEIFYYRNLVGSPPTGTFSLTDSVNHFTNILPGDSKFFCLLPHNYFDPAACNSFGGVQNYFVTNKLSRDSEGRLLQSTSGFTSYPNAITTEPAWAGDFNNDTLQSAVGDDVFAIFAEGLGLIFYNWREFESFGDWRLTLCIKGGDTILLESFLVTDRNQEDLKFASIQVDVFPNPVKDIFHIRMKNDSQAIISLFDLRGNEWLKQEFSGTETEISTSQIPSGIYFIKVISDGVSFTKKIILTGH